MSDFNKTRLYADIVDRDDLIKQQQARIAELEQREAELAKDKSKTCEAYNKLADAYVEVESQRDELAATVERLRGEINTTVVEAIEQYVDDGGNNYWIVKQERIEALKEADEATPRQNLNAVKRETARDAIIAAIDDYKREYCGQGIEALLASFAETYPNKRYPDKD